MWETLASKILRNRITLLIVLAVITGFMLYQSQFVKLSYEFGGFLPKDDVTYEEYDKFTDIFGADGNIVVLGIDGSEIYTQNNFNAWYDLGNDLKKIDGIDSIFSIAHLYNLQKNEKQKKFDLDLIVKSRPETQKEIDNYKEIIESLPFYRGLLYNDSTKASLMMIFVNADKFNSDQRGDVIEVVQERVDQFSADYIPVAYSGLPYIRTVTSKRVQDELIMFVLLAGLVTAFILFLFFRSFKIVLFSLLVVGIGVIWSLGMISLFNFRLSMLMGLIPPLIIVIGIPNCVFLLNKYHQEYVSHGNRIKALVRVISKIGNAIFLTNLTTALGFATFIFTSSNKLKEFGVIASINILGVFVLALLLIPIIFSYLSAPKSRHIEHLKRRWLKVVVNVMVNVVQYHRTAVYITTIVLLLIGAYGVSLLKTTGNIVDDLPDGDQVIVDLRYFEKNFKGIMPFEILIDTEKKGQAIKSSNLKKIEKLQNVLSEYPELSKSVSIVDAIKYAKQAFYNGKESKYQLIKGNEKSFIAPYFQEKNGDGGIGKVFLNEDKSIARINAQVADIGTIEMDSLFNVLQPRIDEIFNPEKYNVITTGTSVVFLKGTTYLVKNLFISLMIAIVMISLIMFLLFKSTRIVLISLIPNLIPLFLTAAIMGYFNVNIKPSTILVFSVVFGISVDDTIHFLAKFRQELIAQDWYIRGSVVNAVKETGVSMVYSSIILFFGFGVFTASHFGGTRAIGLLSSVTLLIAMMSNLILLPTLLMALEKWINKKSFKEPLFQILDEEEDIELDKLEIKNIVH
ncbi:MAG: putative RND superfamily exporter protein [Patiriisocius sp.]|jgi:predicted RND superfamily exporter protein